MESKSRPPSVMKDQKKVLKAVQYRSLNEARTLLEDLMAAPEIEAILDDGDEEPQGLLTIIPEDRVSEETFHALFDLKKGVLIEVEKIIYSGFGPPADPHDYMGFISEHCAYVVKGQHYPIEISNCPQKAMDIHHLEALILDHQHPLNREYLQQKLELGENWDFDDLFELIAAGVITGEEIDRIIHQGIQ